VAVVLLDGTNLSMTDGFVANLAQNLRQGQWVMPDVEAHLAAYRSPVQGIGARLPVPPPADMRDPILRTRLLIAASPETPYILVKKLLFTANKRGFVRVGFLVRNDHGAVSELALPWSVRRDEPRDCGCAHGGR
jgi:hypothetical protein